MKRPNIKGSSVAVVPSRRSLRPRIVEDVEGGGLSSGGLYFSSEKKDIEFFPSGCTLLDCILGGGWAVGRVANIVGDKSSGKTLLAMEAAANFLQVYPHGHVKYKENESAFDPPYAVALGIPMDKIDVEEDLNTVEDLFKDLDALIKASDDDEPILYIVDSLDALSDDAEMARDIGQGSYGTAKAKNMSEMFRRLVRKLKQKRVAVLIVSQVRDNIGISFGKKTTRSGGRALDFYASQVLWLTYIKQLKRTVSKQERPVGVIIRAKCEKLKVGLPFRSCDFTLTFGFGVEDELASREFLKEIGEGALAKLEGAELRAAVIKEWYNIERTFLPVKAKYGAS